MSFTYNNVKQAVQFIEAIKKKIVNLNINLTMDNVRMKINIELSGPRDLQRLATFLIQDLFKEILKKEIS
ncbi:MAG: hypothetical protein KAX10_10360 [Candidatus Lokiarchaeota archaeon]|uniref:Uncharacterized protein n=1 Tax=marine sediment metagenome TaxID=412755 RepID=X1BUW6_9ZZZZ|nr:hypothetical protein [Candidatus Lokiarchaeota archaeon]